MVIKYEKYYPTKEHEEAAKKFVELFSKDKKVKAILLTCSCARGKAHKSSCVDFAIVVKDLKDKKDIKKKFEEFTKNSKEYKKLKELDKFTHIDLDVIDGTFRPSDRGICSQSSEFELELGNYIAYSIILFERDKYFSKLTKRYLPYYNESLRLRRLNRTIRYCLNHLDHIEQFVKRKLHFQAYERLLDSVQGFMQALFIKNKVYPIAYDKWVKDQYYEILKRPDLYKKIVDIISIKKFESNEINIKSKKLMRLIEKELK
jgi:predicted nucleotidyltransferase